MSLLDTTGELLGRLALRSLSARRGRSRLLVLTYHRILPAPDPLLPSTPDAALFRQQMSFLAGNFRFLPLPEAVDRLFHNDLPSRAASITFDDGYANNHDVAVPILRDLGLTATFLIATGFLDGSCMWNDTVVESVRRCSRPPLNLTSAGLGSYPLDGASSRIAAIRDINRQIKYLPPVERQRMLDTICAEAAVKTPAGLMMNPLHVRNLAEAGMDIGCHTVSHPILASLDEAQARREIVESSQRIKEILGQQPRSFAYPNGLPGQDYLPIHVQMVREAGFTQALTMVGGLATSAHDRFQLPRVSPLWKPNNTSLAANLARIYREG